MRWIVVPIITLICCSFAAAEVINVEFKFTPFIGDPAKDNQVETIPGTARVYINNVILAEQEVRKETASVMFDEREIAPSVWVPVAQLGPRLRKGKNAIRIEFEPADAKAGYTARLGWAFVTDQITKRERPGHFEETNQTGRGAETKRAVGKVMLQREFSADFAQDLPWHHYQPVNSLSNEDKQRLIKLISERAKAFKPDFSVVYRLLEGKADIKAGEIRKAKCLEKAYATGVRIIVPASDQFDFITTGNPELVVERKGGDLFALNNPALLERIKNDDVQMCAAVALYVAYPPRVIVVRTPAGNWEAVY